MDIVPKLQMNLHPKDADNLSFVTARNIKISNDESCFTNEESIRKNTIISDFLDNYYNINDADNNYYEIVGIIPCNDELVLICVGNNNRDKAQIFRYQEHPKDINTPIKCVYGAGDSNYLTYHEGKIKGAFTYNVENSLIIAIAEYDGNTEKIPLRTINLGNYDDSTIYNDTNINNSSLSISPEVRIPSMSNVQYISGNAYKGWYYIFIRFKINSVDYTQWFNFGYPIYVDTIEQFNVVKYCYNRDTKFTIGPWDDHVYNHPLPNILFPANPDCGYVAGCSDYFSDTSDIAKETFKFNISFNNIDFDKYQIGIINASKTLTRAFRSTDIIRQDGNNYFALNIASLVEASAEEFIIDNYNYFDVKNIINYQNRLYISNYKENNANDDTISQDIIDNINVKIHNSYISTNELYYELGLVNYDNDQSNQYNSYSIDRISFADFFHCSPDTSFTVTINDEAVATDTADKFVFTMVYSDSNTGDVTLGNSSFGYLKLAHYEYAGVGQYNFVPLGSGAGNYTKKVNIHNNDDSNFQDYTYLEGAVAIQRGRPYINSNIDFNLRKIYGTLIPGEIYNFFVHFVDKYGHSTNGYRINNKYKWTAGDKTDIVPVTFYSDILKQNIYAALDIDADVTDGVTLNTHNIKFYDTIGQFELLNELTGNLVVENITIDELLIKDFTNYFNSFASTKYINVKWFQVALPINQLMPYINNNNERLFRAPFVTDSGIANLNPDQSRQISTKRNYVCYPEFSNIKVPDGYVGYFISYEKYEPTLKYTGLLTRNDFRSQDYIKDKNLDTVNNKKSDYVNFYCGQFDISDSINLDYNILRIEGENVFKTDDIPEYDYMQLSKVFSYPHDMNKPQTGYTKPIRNYGIDDYKLSVADSSIDSRMGVGTCMKIKDIYNIFPTYEPTADVNNKIKLFRVSLCNYSRDIYMSNSKTLIRLTNIQYVTSNNSETTYSVSCRYGLPGHLTNDGFIVYENSGYSHNTADNVVRRFNDNTKYYKSEVSTNEYHTYENDVPFAAYIQMPVYSDVFFESKCFKNEPAGIVYYVKQGTSTSDKADRTDETNKFWGGCLVSPANTIDLFENRQGSFDSFYAKTFTNYREDLVSIDNFNKTVRRSSVIQDETRVNGWRTFSIEAYKNIAENKGNITNLVGVGTVFLVHTEHSLFMFNTDNTLINNDSQQVQLAQPDAFDVKYREIFTSTLGYGGLQDDKSFVVDKFGYIYYNNDFHRFYNFDNGRLNIIDDDIVQWLDKYKPHNVRFANDKFNNRLLIKMNYVINNEEKDIVLSYNYNTKHFVSLHDYYFEEAFNTKYKLYLKCNTNNHANCSLHEFIQDGSLYGSFDNVKATIGISTTYPAKFGIIINPQYDDIKFLEAITYKLVKCANPVTTDYTNSPVEELLKPYSADTIRIYNGETDTGTLDILIDKEESKNIFCNYKKPYWNLGNWNFNYIRNNVANYTNYGDAFNMNRIYGNYFVIEYTLSNSDNLKVEFEELKYNISK